MTTLADRLRDARERRGLTQAALAIRGDINLRTLCRYEKGDSVPDSDALRRLCDALEVSADWLLGTVHPHSVTASAAAAESAS